jgi:uncharacterized protein (TIGR00369 family)
MHTPEDFNRLGAGHLPAHLGLLITHAGKDEMRGEMTVQPQLMAPNGFLHAGSLVTLADTLCGYGCVVHMPPGATGFTTVELKSNHLGTVREGRVVAVARPVHVGRTTQVWDATVSAQGSGKVLALFRCTQMLLYPK